MQSGHIYDVFLLTLRHIDILIKYFMKTLCQSKTSNP